ncbi:MAG: hypothetical protein U1E26_00655 [Coriobacteriia bacterium]|nr:hypothetical protein [Coriobacteriia bacterium]
MTLAYSPRPVARAALCALAIVATLAIAPSAFAIPDVHASATATPSIDAYRGLGGWIDIWDKPAFDRPEAAIRDMANHGVRTVYIETSNSSRTYAIHRPDRTARLIRAAHARGMKVVAWYLPDLRWKGRDLDRVKAAIRFRTSDGQRFDSFALDIESSVVKPAAERNRRLKWVSDRTRAFVGPRYPLGAIIPSPKGMQSSKTYWPGFPYSSLAATYDVFVPMSYYTYHGDGYAAAYADTLANVRILRAQPGCATEPIHLIGGVASKSSAYEVRAFVRAANETGVEGASLYSWPEMTKAHWAELKALKR